MKEVKLSPEETFKFSDELFVYVVRGTINVSYEIKNKKKTVF
jgi:hypothetical protein